MKFEEALIELRKGKKIHCVSLNTMNLSLSDSYEICMESFNFAETFDIIEMIIKGEWFVVEEPGKTFDQVFESFKEGKKIRRKSWNKEGFIKGYNTNMNIYPHDLSEKDWEICE